MSPSETRPATLRAALRHVLLEANGVPVTDLEQAVLCFFCDGTMLDRLGAGCEVVRSECPKVSACGHKRDSTAEPARSC